MTNTRRLLGGVILPFLPVLAVAVNLSDFTPRNTGLSTQCNVAYTKTIPSCQEADFTESNPNICSLACVKGLAAIQSEIQNKCSSDVVSETSMVGLFLLGSGVSVLCPNFKVQTLRTTTTSARSTATIGSSTLKISSETAIASSIAADTSSAIPPETTADTPAATSSGDLILDTTPAPSPTGGFSVEVSASTTSSKAAQQSQKSNKDSGGGSPFDIQATTNEGASSAGISLPALLAPLFTLVIFL